MRIIGIYQGVPPPYQQPHWSALTVVSHQQQEVVGESPLAWASRLCLPNLPTSPPLPEISLDRVQVMEKCNDPDPTRSLLFGYICAMAWGGQGRPPYSQRNAQDAWASSETIVSHLEKLLAGGLSRKAAYQIFENEGKVPGLGASFFTKLLYFFSANPLPGEEPYIVDNFILKGMALLTGLPFNSFATRGGYQACCEEMDAMGVLLGCNGSQVEERIFGPWRSYLVSNAASIPPKTGRLIYRQTMYRAYPHIPQSDF